MAVTDTPHPLAALLDRHGMSLRRFAALVREWCLQAGDTQAVVDHTQVLWWRRGVCPEPRYRAAVVAVATVLEGHEVSCAELGMPEIPVPTGDPLGNLGWNPRDTVEALRTYPGSIVMPFTRRHVLEATSIVTGAALLAPLHRWLDAKPADDTETNSDELHALRDATRRFRSWDHAEGGASPMPEIAGRLAWAGALLEGNRRGRLSKAMFAAYADFLEVAGWSAFDAGFQGEAQRLLRLSIHAAAMAGDRSLAANAASDLARQLIYLDRPGDALEVVRLAQRSCEDTATPAMHSMLRVVEARAHARLGRLGITARRRASADARRAIDRAREIFTDWRAGTEPVWVDYFGPAQLDGDTGEALSDVALYDESVREPLAAQLTAASAGYGDTYARSRLFVLTDGACVRMLQGELDEAYQAGMVVAAHAKGIRSHRTTARIGELQALARCHRVRDPRMRQLDHELAAATA